MSLSKSLRLQMASTYTMMVVYGRVAHLCFTCGETCRRVEFKFVPKLKSWMCKAIRDGGTWRKRRRRREKIREFLFGLDDVTSVFDVPKMDFLVAEVVWWLHLSLKVKLDDIERLLAAAAPSSQSVLCLPMGASLVSLVYTNIFGIQWPIHLNIFQLKKLIFVWRCWMIESFQLKCRRRVIDACRVRWM